VKNHRKNTGQVEALRRQIAQFEGGQAERRPTVVSSGCQPLDRLLPGRGFRRGTLIEWLAVGEGSGAGTLALAAAGAACRDGGMLVVLDRRREFYPPAALYIAVDPQNLIVVRAAGQADNDWVLDQALRSPAVAAVLAWPEKLDGRTFRRLQLAAEESGAVGLFVRSASVRDEPSWADVRLLVEPLPLPAGVESARMRRLRIHLLRYRGTTNGRRVNVDSLDVDIDDETHTMHLVTPLAVATAPRQATRA